MTGVTAWITWRYCNFSLWARRTTCPFTALTLTTRMHVHTRTHAHAHTSSLLSPHPYPLKEPMVNYAQRDYNTVNSEMKNLFLFVIVILNVLHNSVDSLHHSICREKCKAGYCLSRCAVPCNLLCSHIWWAQVLPLEQAGQDTWLEHTLHSLNSIYFLQLVEAQGNLSGVIYTALWRSWHGGYVVAVQHDLEVASHPPSSFTEIVPIWVIADAGLLDLNAPMVMEVSKP